MGSLDRGLVRLRYWYCRVFFEPFSENHLGRTVRILFLDDDDDLRSTFGEVFRVFGNGKHSCLCLASYEEMLAQKDAALATGLAILDINLGENRPSGLDAERWLRAHEYVGKVVLLTGHARSHPLVSQAAELAGVEVLEKPVAVGRLLDLIEKED